MQYFCHQLYEVNRHYTCVHVRYVIYDSWQVVMYLLNVLCNLQIQEVQVIVMCNIEKLYQPLECLCNYHLPCYECTNYILRG